MSETPEPLSEVERPERLSQKSKDAEASGGGYVARPLGVGWSVRSSLESRPTRRGHPRTTPDFSLSVEGG